MAQSTALRSTSITASRLGNAQFKANPYALYAQLRDESPVHRISMFKNQATWLVTRYDDVLTVLKDERFAKDRFKVLSPEQRSAMPYVPKFARPLQRHMLDLDGEEHFRLRSLVHKAFTPRLIERLRDRVQELCDEMVQAVQAQGRMDLIRQYALPLPVTIIAELLGVPEGERHKFQVWSRSIASVTTATDFMLALPHVWLFLRYLRGLVKQRRAKPQDDLLTGLLQAEEAGDVLSEDELLGMLFLLLVAGHETTVNLIGNGMLALLQHRDQLERLRRDPELIKSAIEELLRFSSPVEVATERFASEELVLGGQRLQRGDMVLAALASANRDERQFTAPDVLDIAREPNRHVAFGHGIHYCLGAPLARLEGQIALSTLIARLPNMQLDIAPERVRWRKGMFLRGLERLPLAFSR